MTRYQDCHRHYGYLTHETAIARKLLERHGRPCPETVKELRSETDMPMAECADMLRCMWRDMELERLQAEIAELREERREYQATIDSLVDECADHKAENAKLRIVMEDLEECDRIHRTMLRRMTELNAKADAENSKLRELVVEALACKDNDGCCEDCYADEGDCPIRSHMRELGIEVEE